MSVSAKMKHLLPVLDRGTKDPWNHDIRRHGDDMKLDLWMKKPRRKVGVKDLFTALRDHLRPGIALEFVKKNSYLLVDISNSRPPKRITSVKAWGAKLLYFSNRTSPSLYIIMLKKAWHFINSGVRVEFHVQAKGLTGKPIANKEARMTGVAVYKGQKLEQFNWKDEESLAKLSLDPSSMIHLRPDVILRAMPEGTHYAISPVANFEQYVWVLAPPNMHEQDGIRTFTRLAAQNPGAVEKAAARKAADAVNKEPKWLQKSALSNNRISSRPLQLSHGTGMGQKTGDKGEELAPLSAKDPWRDYRDYRNEIRNDTRNDAARWRRRHIENLRNNSKFFG